MTITTHGVTSVPLPKKYEKGMFNSPRRGVAEDTLDWETEML